MLQVLPENLTLRSEVSTRDILMTLKELILKVWISKTHTMHHQDQRVNLHRWVVVDLQVTLKFLKTKHKSLLISKQLNQTQFILYNKQLAGIILYHLLTEELIQTATILWTTCSSQETQDLWWWLEKILTSKTFTVKWFSKFKENSNYSERSKAKQLIIYCLRI